ncbi:MAG: XdhC family protein, partial [Ktedonobacterales bacterium]|nr:XdhC family protein [Ktedonobacterales bacterium]
MWRLTATDSGPIPSPWPRQGERKRGRLVREVLADIEHWWVAGKRVALASVVAVVGSAPRGVGAVLAVSEAGEIAGSVSGGCVE